ncbi:MAG: hypothetical protein LBK95_00345, partial [Bifidobacteriaceae bacterium]|nr:hypothetical protein [Bifidobacteriaceae bacterium]
MVQASDYKCPRCGAPAVFDPAWAGLYCQACGSAPGSSQQVVGPAQKAPGPAEQVADPAQQVVGPRTTPVTAASCSEDAASAPVAAAPNDGPNTGWRQSPSGAREPSAPPTASSSGSNPGWCQAPTRAPEPW